MNNVVTVGELIDFLKSNFTQDQKLCYWHEGGAWIECEHVSKSDLGKWFLRKIGNEKKSRFENLEKRGYSKEELERDLSKDYKQVDDDFVLIY